MLQFFAATRKEPGRKLTDSSVAEWLGGGAPVAAGIAVTPESALSSTVVLACVRAIAEDVAKLPLHLNRRDARDRRVKDLATDHPLYWLLKTEPNPYQTSFEFREWLQASELMYGYGVAEIETNRYGSRWRCGR
jgi:phage portal protein BeeE